MSELLDITDLVALHQWEQRSEAVVEGSATRAEVLLETGDEALLYRWSDETTAARAALVHDFAGAELFAVPQALHSGPGWVVVTRPDGVPASEVFGADATLGGLGSAATELAGSLGNALRKLHNLPTPGSCGDVLEEVPDKSQCRWLTFSGWVANRLEFFVENLRTQQFTDGTVAELSTSIADMRHELSAFHPRTPPSTVHAKPSLAHVWVDKSGREVVAITGFEHASFLPRESDIAYLLWIEGLGADERAAKAFYQGYGAARTMDVQRRERFYRRLVSFEALSGMKGAVPRTAEELIALTSSQAF